MATNEFEVGDIVSRDRSDLQRVVESSCDLITVVCIKEPAEGWVKLGEREDNLSRRYNLVLRRADAGSSALSATVMRDGTTRKTAAMCHRMRGKNTLFHRLSAWRKRVGFTTGRFLDG